MFIYQVSVLVTVEPKTNARVELTVLGCSKPNAQAVAMKEAKNFGFPVRVLNCSEGEC